jgi:hypothetical protein
MIEVNNLWIGLSLSKLENACLTSHVRQGHKVNLWTYGDVANIPDGVVLKDGREILPENEVFTYQVGEGKGSYSAFSNFFRYKLLLERGGWWTDSDVYCLKPFDFEPDHVYASERTKEDDVVTTCVIKVHAGSPVMKYCWDRCCSTDKQTVGWGTIGPKLLGEAVRMIGGNVMPPNTFCPVDWFDLDQLFEEIDTPDSHGIHLWNEMWRRKGLDKDGRYGRGTLYGRLTKGDICTHTEDRRNKYRYSLGHL